MTKLLGVGALVLALWPLLGFLGTLPVRPLAEAGFTVAGMLFAKIPVVATVVFGVQTVLLVLGGVGLLTERPYLAQQACGGALSYGILGLAALLDVAPYLGHNALPTATYLFGTALALAVAVPLVPANQRYTKEVRRRRRARRSPPQNQPPYPYGPPSQGFPPPGQMPPGAS